MSFCAKIVAANALGKDDASEFPGVKTAWMFQQIIFNYIDPNWLFKQNIVVFSLSALLFI